MQRVGEFRTGAVATDDTVNCGKLWNTRLLSLSFQHCIPRQFRRYRSGSAFFDPLI